MKRDELALHLGNFNEHLSTAKKLDSLKVKYFCNIAISIDDQILLTRLVGQLSLVRS